VTILFAPNLTSQRLNPSPPPRKTMNRLLFGLFAAVVALQSAMSTAIDKDGSVLVLTDSNFEDAIKVKNRGSLRCISTHVGIV